MRNQLRLELSPACVACGLIDPNLAILLAREIGVRLASEMHMKRLPATLLATAFLAPACDADETTDVASLVDVDLDPLPAGGKADGLDDLQAQMRIACPGHTYDPLSALEFEGIDGSYVRAAVPRVGEVSRLRLDVDDVVGEGESATYFGTFRRSLSAGWSLPVVETGDFIAGDSFLLGPVIVFDIPGADVHVLSFQRWSFSDNVASMCLLPGVDPETGERPSPFMMVRAGF